MQLKGETHQAFGLGSTISQATAGGHDPLLWASNDFHWPKIDDVSLPQMSK
jgi:hypothetical protein